MYLWHITIGLVIVAGEGLVLLTLARSPPVSMFQFLGVCVVVGLTSIAWILIMARAERRLMHRLHDSEFSLCPRCEYSLQMP